MNCADLNPSRPSLLKQHKMLVLALVCSVLAHFVFFAFQQWSQPSKVGPSKNKVTVTFVSKAPAPVVAPPQEIVVNTQPTPVKKEKSVIVKADVGNFAIKTQKTTPKPPVKTFNESVFKPFNDSVFSEHKEVNENTKDYLYAQYFDDWKKKVERIGTMNYPQDVQSATLVLKVVLRQDGSVESIRVVRSSGNKAADDAAINTVNFAAPFSKFPPEMAKQVKYLDITKTWSFSKNRLETR